MSFYEGHRIMIRTRCMSLIRTKAECVCVCRFYEAHGHVTFALLLFFETGGTECTWPYFASERIWQANFLRRPASSRRDAPKPCNNSNRHLRKKAKSPCSSENACYDSCCHLATKASCRLKRRAHLFSDRILRWITHLSHVTD